MAGGWRCHCGRFAKFVSLYRAFNGWFESETLTVNCSRCGVVTIALV